MNHAPKKPEAQSEIGVFFFIYFSLVLSFLHWSCLHSCSQMRRMENIINSYKFHRAWFSLDFILLLCFLCIAAHLRCRGRASQPYSSAAPKGDRENANNRKVEKTHYQDENSETKSRAEGLRRIRFRIG